MDKTLLIIVAVSTITVTLAMAEALDSVGQYQLDAAYICADPHYSQQHPKTCAASFGSRIIQ